VCAQVCHTHTLDTHTHEEQVSTEEVVGGKGKNVCGWECVWVGGYLSVRVCVRERERRNCLSNVCAREIAQGKDRKAEAEQHLSTQEEEPVHRLKTKCVCVCVCVCVSRARREGKKG
jgi:hypothetical protein